MAKARTTGGHVTRAARTDDPAAPASPPEPTAPATARREGVMADILRRLPGALAALAEGAWVSVVAAVLAAGARDTARLGPIGFALAALIGLAAARRFGDRPRWPEMTVALTVAAGLAGWLADPGARAAIAGLDLGDAATHHLGGWLAGVALLRGSAHARPASSQGAMESLLAVGLPGLAIPILIGGALEEPWRSRFAEDARLGVVLFLVAATVGVGVARLAALRGPLGFDWRGNRAWLALIVVLVLGVSLLALPLASIVGPAVQVAIAALFLPAVVLGAIAGMRQVSRRAVVLYVAASVLLIILFSAAPTVRVPLPENPDTGTGATDPTTDSTAAYLAIAVAILVVIVLGVLFLARLWSRDALARRGGDVPEERWIDTGERTPMAGRRFGRVRRPRRIAPTTAAEAYLATLADLEGQPERRREPAESPAEHAARLRASRQGALSLDLLAADYELVRFGGGNVSAQEDRRAVRRWRRLRERRPPA
jgi:Domain of unknown function (DUF4129)